MHLSSLGVVCDLETSGKCPVSNGVISITLLVINKQLQIIDKAKWRVCPPDLSPNTWSLKAQEKHGFTIAEVMQFMPNDQFCYELLCFLGKYKEHFPLNFICHASPNGMPNQDPITRKVLGGWEIIPWFDYFFLENCYRKAKFENGSEMVWTFNKVFNISGYAIEVATSEDNGHYEIIHKNNRTPLISTVQMGRKAGYKKNRLDLWAERIGFNLKHHDDESDTYCALEVYKYLLNQNSSLEFKKENTDEIWHLS